MTQEQDRQAHRELEVPDADDRIWVVHRDSEVQALVSVLLHCDDLERVEAALQELQQRRVEKLIRVSHCGLRLKVTSVALEAIAFYRLLQLSEQDGLEVILGASTRERI